MSVEDDVIRGIINELLDSCVMEDVFSIHRSIKLGYYHLMLADPEDFGVGESEPALLSSSKSDLLNKSSACCHCVKCHSKVAATRFAPHLANCMGLGRNSSRRANKRIAEQQRFEDSDDVDEAYYLEHSPLAVSANKNDSSALVNYQKNHSSGYPSRSSKANHKLSGLTSCKSPNGRSTSTSLPVESVFEKTDSYESISFSCDDEESNSSEATRRPGVSRIRRHQKLHV